MNAMMEGIQQHLKSHPGQLVPSVQGLDGFCNAWGRASTKTEFQDAQLQTLLEMYMLPSQLLAKDAFLTHAVSIGQIYDSTVQLGHEGTKDLISIVVSHRGPSDPLTEMDWLNEFLTMRQTKLTSMGGAYAPTVTRVRSYQYAVSHSDPDFKTLPVQALDNDGNPISVYECDYESNERQIPCLTTINLPDVSKLDHIYKVVQ
eukprot:jgi/Hompol1/6000/HPOL_000666-RA